MSINCLLESQNVSQGACLTCTPLGKYLPACQVTLKRSKDSSKGLYSRLIKSMHLSRPEDYFSIYQSGCNHNCLKCHSSDFTKHVNGIWYSSDMLAKISVQYLQEVTVFEPFDRATMYHAEDLCHHCGSCVLFGVRSKYCPQKLRKSQIALSPQGFGPARNIIAFTGGDISCHPAFYAQTATKIKQSSQNRLWVLLETNGYALTRKNLLVLKEGGIDAFWLDIKAFNKQAYQKLCGVPSNTTVLGSLDLMKDLEFIVEVLTLYIPDIVESDQHKQIAKLISEIDPKIPTTLLAFFPSYQLNKHRSPTFKEMLKSYFIMKGEGLINLRLGNIGIFAKTPEEREILFKIKW